MRYLGLVSFRVGKLASYSWHLIRPKNAMTGARARARATYRSIWHMCNFKAKFVTLPHEVVRRLHLCPFR